MRNSIVLFFSCLLVLACNNKVALSSYKTIPELKWHKDSVVSFKIHPPDTLQPYNVYVNLRNTQKYKYNNLFLIVEMNFPHGKTIKDTLEYKMAKPNGELLGTGFSDIKENKLWYKEGVIFKEPGTYTLNIQQAMRENGKINGVVNLEGVSDVGFSIEIPEIK
ncbi:gliding motility protein GldH [Mangrovimonas yunxiaonensis]|uniref:Gliding motility protein GldH n=1 Tax=Mangrovimonas yunxiaonensis TaxID=1197477 RepID=A0A084TKF0_9FLAO|nr:gliding motility lipoprotein GldH [Mangrovimonas yunxiaonensis]KFB01186.1 gliding motility protein GldH [Mangrovimonas yunxiaonensis]